MVVKTAVGNKMLFKICFQTFADTKALYA